MDADDAMDAMDGHEPAQVRVAADQAVHSAHSVLDNSAVMVDSDAQHIQAELPTAPTGPTAAYPEKNEQSPMSQEVLPKSAEHVLTMYPGVANSPGVSPMSPE